MNLADFREDYQRGALDRFAGVEAKLERYKKVRHEWQVARRDLVDRTNRARELAQEADRLKFALTEIDGIGRLVNTIVGDAAFGIA